MFTGEMTGETVDFPCKLSGNKPFMDFEETAETGKRGFFSGALRFCTVLIFSIFSFFFLSFLVGLVMISFGELPSVSSPASVLSRCRIVSSSVDLRSSKVCGFRLLNNNAQHAFYPFENNKFRCRYDYYWASIFKVEYRDHSLGRMLFAFAEAPNEALPLDCRPNFGTAWLTKDNFKVNETYNCWYTLGISKIKLYPDGFFGCQAKETSLIEIIKQYTILFSKFLHSWFTVKERPRYWRWETFAGIASGFATSIFTIFVVKILQHIKSRFVQACSTNMLSRVQFF